MNAKSCQPNKIFVVIVVSQTEVRVVKRTFCCFSMQITAPKPEGKNIQIFSGNHLPLTFLLKVGKLNLHDVPTPLQTAHL